jgi:hypothetical protein
MDLSSEFKSFVPDDDKDNVYRHLAYSRYIQRKLELKIASPSLQDDAIEAILMNSKAIETSIADSTLNTIKLV